MSGRKCLCTHCNAPQGLQGQEQAPPYLKTCVHCGKTFNARQGMARFDAALIATDQTSWAGLAAITLLVGIICFFAYHIFGVAL